MNSFHKRLLEFGWKENHWKEDWSNRYFELLREASSLENKLCEVISFVTTLGKENEILHQTNNKLLEENKILKDQLDKITKL
jgi:hypothetical protein